MDQKIAGRLSASNIEPFETRAMHAPQGERFEKFG
jgi:hypothetical protein